MDLAEHTTTYLSVLPASTKAIMNDKYVKKQLVPVEIPPATFQSSFDPKRIPLPRSPNAYFQTRTQSADPTLPNQSPPSPPSPTLASAYAHARSLAHQPNLLSSVPAKPPHCANTPADERISFFHPAICYRAPKAPAPEPPAALVALNLTRRRVVVIRTHNMPSACIESTSPRPIYWPSSPASDVLSPESAQRVVTRRALPLHLGNYIPTFCIVGGCAAGMDIPNPTSRPRAAPVMFSGFQMLSASETLFLWGNKKPRVRARAIRHHRDKRVEYGMHRRLEFFSVDSLVISSTI